MRQQGNKNGTATVRPKPVNKPKQNHNKEQKT